jgi:pyridoxamine 5'-phosphate oxidase
MTAGAQGIADTPMVELDGETYEEPRFSVRCPVPPSTRFAEWMAAAIESEQPEPMAMALASLSTSGAPRLRWVLCKGWKADGLRFYTNLRSQKGVQLLNDHRVVAAFHWVGLERQVRVEALDDPMADAYYETRPRLSRMGVAAEPAAIR